MKNWKKTSLITALALIVLMIVAFKVFNLKLLKASSNNIEFSPADYSPKSTPDSLKIKPKNIIVFIADGFGFAHLSLAMLTQQVKGEPSVWDRFDTKGWHDTRCTYGPLTDSGAAATAMATGTPTYWEVIGLDPEGNQLENVLELASENLYNTGIVTDSYIWDATPAAFVAHTKSRDNARDILEQIATSDLDLIFGELEDLGQDDVPDYDETMQILTKKYTLLNSSLELPKYETSPVPIAAIFDEDQVQDMGSSPNLPQLTMVALNYLSTNNQPFVLMVEGEEMDSASHRNDSKRVIAGLEALQKTLLLILDFSEKNGETLVVFTSDHETGGLAAVSEKDYPNLQLVWSTNNHTASVVPLFAKGPGADNFLNVNRNWEIGVRLKDLINLK